jgi:hypothetical protein
MRIIKFKLTPDQEEAIRPLLTMAALADENKERGLIIAQVVGGYAHCTFLGHETAVNVCAAKAGLAKPSKLNRKRVEQQMGGMK